MKNLSKNTAKEFTKNCIMDALLQLMHTKDYEQITISELTRKAGVSRMSYYRSYSSKDSILTDYMHRILKEYAEELKGPAFQADFQKRPKSPQVSADPNHQPIKERSSPKASSFCPIIISLLIAKASVLLISGCSARI